MNSIHMIHIFSNSQARGRIYRIGNGSVVMPVKVVSSLSRWNSDTFRGLEIFDRKVVDVLVHICQDFIKEELSCRAAIRFIKGITYNANKMKGMNDSNFYYFVRIAQSPFGCCRPKPLHRNEGVSQ